MWDGAGRVGSWTVHRVGSEVILNAANVCRTQWSRRHVLTKWHGCNVFLWFIVLHPSATLSLLLLCCFFPCFPLFFIDSSHWELWVKPILWTRTPHDPTGLSLHLIIYLWEPLSVQRWTKQQWCHFLSVCWLVWSLWLQATIAWWVEAQIIICLKNAMRKLWTSFFY